jgi:lipopolysaccharide biosynthesis glycosyltransferase
MLMADNKIQIAFCFDIKMFEPACVSVASLLDSKNIEDHFDIHCIVDEASINRKDLLLDIVSKRDFCSSISFYPAPNTFASSYETRGISKATYMRFAIHRLIPNINKIIYSDVDVLFCDSIKELWETDIENYYFAGVKGTNNFANKWAAYADLGYFEELDGLRGKYINAGILLMNLQRIRDTHIEDEWIERSKRHYEYQDQDIINISCKNQILLLPLKYNVAGYLIPK